MNGPIPVRPQEPRWWVSTNGQVEGPYGQAYLIACLTAGQIPATALLCLEGSTQWQQLSAWPQFNIAAGPIVNVGNEGGSLSTAVHRQANKHLLNDAQVFATYATVISPMILLAWAATFFWEFDPSVNTIADLLFVIILVGIEGVPRAISMIGATQLSSSPSAAVSWFQVGAVAVLGVLGLKLAVVLFAILFLMESSGSPRMIFVVSGGILLLNACEFVYLLLSLFTLAKVRKQLR